MSEDAPEYKNKQDKTYEQKVEELDDILRKLDDSEIPIDDLGQKARTGAHFDSRAPKTVEERGDRSSGCV